jgi:hypothetical protein
LEELNDKHKSLDFGMEIGGGKPGKKGKKGPQMAVDPEKSMRRGRGLSMDMDMNSPYLLPAGLNQSRESFHSLSRSVKDGGDPYQPITFIKSDDPYTRMRGDNASIYTGSSGNTTRTDARLIRNQSPFPPRGESRITDSSSSPVHTTTPEIKFPEPAHQPNQQRHVPELPVPAAHGPNSLFPGQDNAGRDSYFDRNAQDMRNSNNYLTNYISKGDSVVVTNPTPQPAQELPVPPEPPVLKSEPKLPELEVKSVPPSPPQTKGLPSNPRPIRQQSMEATIHNPNTASMISDSSDYGDAFKVTPPSPPRGSEVQQPYSVDDAYNAPIPVAEEDYHHAMGLGVQDLGFDSRRLSMSIRPLPVEDPTDNPEQRANRIRSFYKEYFDDSKPDPAGYYGTDDLVDDYGHEYLDGAVFDPVTNQFVVARPYAEPVTRRAMTPPPRAPPRFRGGPPGPGRGHLSSGSGQWAVPPRGVSAMSARTAPKKKLPPPTALTSLPTPHMLKEDSAIFNPLDFAPPASFRDRQLGRRPDSPLGTPRPYSPSVRAHVPLESPFQELAPVPSPHMLRKSGTFTALDFAPPPRFRNADTASDAGSIRSNRSGLSAVHHNNIRNGAYRVSRIPKEMVGTRDDLVTALKPKWDLVTPA